LHEVHWVELEAWLTLEYLPAAQAEQVTVTVTYTVTQIGRAHV
jgi:hypothetical protein